MNEKPCEKRTKKKIIDTVCADLGLEHGLSKLKKNELVDLCCYPDGPEKYLKEQWKGPVDVREGSLLGDIILSLDGEIISELLREKIGQDRPMDPLSRGLWQDIEDVYGITKANLFGSPVKCPVSLPKGMDSMTMLVADGDDVYDHKNEIKNELGGTFFSEWMGFQKWAWDLDRCKELESFFEKQGVSMGDVIIDPCTVVVSYNNDHVEKAIKEIDPEPQVTIFGVESSTMASKRHDRFKNEVASEFGIDEDDVTTERVMDLAMNVETMKFFQERFDEYPRWRCGDPDEVAESLETGKAKSVFSSIIAGEDEDVSPSYLQRRREILPKVALMKQGGMSNV